MHPGKRTDVPPSPKEVLSSSGTSKLRTFLLKLRKRRIIETLAAFIGGGWLLVEVVERLLVGHYKFPEESIDLTVVSVIGALLATLVWRWFGGTEKRPGNIKVEVLLVPLIILATLSIDLTILLRIIGISGKTFLIAAVTVCLGIAWIILKSLQWAASAPVPAPVVTHKTADPLGPHPSANEKSIPVMPFTDSSAQKDLASGHAETAPKQKAERPRKAIDAIAVLPFVNVGSDPDTEFLSDGIAESLINRLAQLPRLRVIARTSAFQFKGEGIDPERCASELGVQALVTGRVLRRSEQLSISAELMDVRTKTHVWGEKYNRAFSDIFAVEDDIARQIAERVRPHLVAEVKKRLAKQPARSPKAYELCLRSRQYRNVFTQKSLLRAIEYLEQALVEDPNYALAYGELAMCHWGLSNLGYVPPGEGYPRVKAAAMRALELDGTLAEAHTALGLFSIDYDWDWAAAELEHQRAIELMPGDSWLHMCYSWFLGVVRRHEEAVAEMRLARELDPLSIVPAACVGEELMLARQSDAAIEQCRRVITLDATYWVSYFFLGLSYQQKNQGQEAVEALEKAAELAERDSVAIAALGNALGIFGRTGEAREILDELRARREKAYLSPYWISLVHLGLGEIDKALDCLETGYEERAAYMNAINVYFHFDPVRSHPRFQDIVRKMNFPERKGF
jgi:TolB-like protein